MDERQVPESWKENSIRPPRGLRPRIIALAAIASAALAVTAYRVIAPGPPPPLPPGAVRPVLAVLAFENESGDPSLDDWRGGIAELLVAGLSPSRCIRVVSTGQMRTALRRLGLTDARDLSAGDIARIALGTHAGHVLRGSFTKAGSTIVITAVLQESEVRPAWPVRSASPPLRLIARGENDIIPRIDKLVRGVKRTLGLTRVRIAHDPAKEVAKSVTASPEAFRHYIEGRRHQLDDRFEQAVASMERAVAIDPRFAMAYRSLGAAHRGLGHYAESRACDAKALSLADRLPPGEGRLIEGAIACEDQDYVMAIATLESLLAACPGHLDALSCLGRAYAGAGNVDKAIDLLSAVSRDRNAEPDVRTLAVYLQRKGRYQEAAELCLAFLQNVEDAWNVRQMLASCYVFLGEPALALAEARKTHRLRPRAAAGLADILVFTGDLAAAEALMGPEPYALDRGRFAANVECARCDVERAMAGGDVDDEAAAERRLAIALEKAGRYVEASVALADAIKLAASGTKRPYYPGRRARDLFIKARLEVEMGLRDAALQTAADLRSLAVAGPSDRDLRYHEYVLGLTELAKGIPLEAAGFFKRACARLDFEDFGGGEQSLFFDGLARAELESGDLAAARGTYEKITLLTTGRREDGDIFARAFYHLGRIAEREGEGAAAIGYYRKFLALWKDADPGLPEIAETKAKLIS